MKRLLLLLIIVGCAMAILRRESAEQRQRLASLPGSMMGRMMEHMPDDLPPKAFMSSLQRIEEQNEQIIARLRASLGLQEAVTGEPAAPEGEPEEA